QTAPVGDRRHDPGHDVQPDVALPDLQSGEHSALVPGPWPALAPSPLVLAPARPLPPGRHHRRASARTNPYGTSSSGSGSPRSCFGPGPWLAPSRTSGDMTQDGVGVGEKQIARK